MAAEGGEARDPSGRYHCLGDQAVSCRDMQQGLAEKLTVSVARHLVKRKF